MKQVGISGDYLEWKQQREDFEYAQKLHSSGEFDRVSIPMDQSDEAAKIVPGRCYYEKRVGWRWQIWFCHSDSSADPASGATEWMAVSTKFWRWKTAARIANEIWSAFNNGVWIANCRHADAANSQQDTTK